MVIVSKRSAIGKNIGFISTRFAGIDGVSLEASKWAKVLESIGHACSWFAGELDRPPTNCFLVPEAHFQDDENQWVNENVIGRKVRDISVTDEIHALRKVLKRGIQDQALICFLHVRLLVFLRLLVDTCRHIQTGKEKDSMGWQSFII